MVKPSNEPAIFSALSVALSKPLPPPPFEPSLGITAKFGIAPVGSSLVLVTARPIGFPALRSFAF